MASCKTVVQVEDDKYGLENEICRSKEVPNEVVCMIYTVVYTSIHGKNSYTGVKKPEYEAQIRKTGCNVDVHGTKIITG